MSMNITYISIYKTSLPVLVSLLMEYLIGFTDTAYLGRISYSWYLLYDYIHDWIWVQHRSANLNSPI